MKRKSLVAIVLLLSSGAALADEKIPLVQVRADAPNSLVLSCADPGARATDVERVLQVNDRAQTRALGHKLKAAAADACSAGIDTIIVSRGASGRSLIASPAAARFESVAAN